MKFTVYYARDSRACIQVVPPKSVHLDLDYLEVAKIEAENEEHAWCLMNVVDGTELPVKLRVRSMCVGDVLRDEQERLHMVAGCGFSSVEEDRTRWCHWCFNRFTGFRNLCGKCHEEAEANRAYNQQRTGGAS